VSLSITLIIYVFVIIRIYSAAIVVVVIIILQTRNLTSSTKSKDSSSLFVALRISQIHSIRHLLCHHWVLLLYPPEVELFEFVIRKVP
jgi:hypothetical protein